MTQSPLCDGKAFVRDVEAAYREIWWVGVCHPSNDRMTKIFRACCPESFGEITGAAGARPV
jgi:hypothetical protein